MSDIAMMIAIAKKFGGSSSTPAPVVILPETELTVIEEDQQAVITTPWAVTPVAGNVYTINFNGVAYDCEAFAVTMEGPPAGTVMLGNAECLANFGITGGNPDAPFYGMLTPTPMGDQYGALYVMDASLTSVTLSIVQTEGGSANSGDTSTGGGVLMINVSFDTEDFNNYSNPTKDKPYAEIKAAYDAGAMLYCKVTIRHNGEVAQQHDIVPVVMYVKNSTTEDFVFKFLYGFAGNKYFAISSDDMIETPYTD